MAAAAGVFLGGVLSQGPGWRWVFFVNPPICVVVTAGALVLLADDRGARARGTAFDSQGAVLVTGGMLLLVYSLIRAPVAGWASVQTIITLAGAAALIVAFALNELRSRNPLVPFAILRVKGLVAGRPDPAHRVHRVLLHVLLRDAVHAGDPPLLAARGGSRLSSDHRGVRRGRRHGLATGHPHRHPPGGGRRLPDRRGRDLLRVPGPPARFVPGRPAARVPGDVPGGGVGIRIRHRRRQRGRATRPGGPGGRVAELVPSRSAAHWAWPSCRPSRSPAPTT